MRFLACVRLAAREIRAGLPRSPGARSLPASRGDSRYWPWLRMQVLRRDGYRCCGCGRPGDEITLQICQVKTHRDSTALMTLCTTCQSRGEHLAKAVPVFHAASRNHDGCLTQQ
jgi:hypothetical protein